MSFAAEVVVLQPGKGTAQEVLGFPLTFKVDGTHTDDGYFLTEITVVHDELPPHTHKSEAEGIYVLEGEINIQVGSETIPAQPGAFVLIPPGTVHTFTPGTDSPRALLLFSPADFGKFFAEAAGIADRDEVIAIAARYGMEVAE